MPSRPITYIIELIGTDRRRNVKTNLTRGVDKIVDDIRFPPPIPQFALLNSLHLDLSAFNFTFNLDNDLGEVSSTLDIPFFAYGVDIEGSPVSGNLTVPETVQISQGFSFPLVEFSSIINPLQIEQGFDLGGVDLSSIVEALKFDLRIQAENINLLIDDLVVQTDQTQSVVGGDPGEDFPPPGAYLGPKIQLYPFSRSVDQGFNFSLPDEMSTSNDFDVDSIGLLDFFPGAAAAYSLRSLDLNYSGDAIRVRRDSDDAEQDFGFDAAGDLDVAGVTSFCGAANGYVVTWYDQANGNDATQSFAVLQPRIYDGTAVLTRNGKPALYFADTNGQRLIFDASTVTQPYTWYGVVQRDDTNFSIVVGWGTGTNFIGRFESQPFSMYAGTYLGSSAFNSTAQQLFYAMFDGSSSELAVDGGTAVTGNAGTNDITGSGSIAAMDDGGLRMRGVVQELILWPSNQSTNRTGIESNIRTYYIFNRLLNNYGGAVAAYSVRKINKYATLSMRVRRDSDDAEQDFGFDASDNLDVAGITSFCGNSNGYVVTWYDQANSNDATQSTTTQQPQIYNGTAVITENGKPAMDFDGSNDKLQATYTDAIDYHGIFLVVSYDSTGDLNSTFSISKSSLSKGDVLIRDNVYAVRFFTGNKDMDLVSITETTSQQLIAALWDGAVPAGPTTLPPDGTLSTYQDGALTDDSAVDSNFNVTGTGILIGADSANFYLNGKMQECIFWDSDQSSNRTGIESNINNYFNIY